MLVLALVTSLAALSQALSFPRGGQQGSYRPNVPRDLADGIYAMSLDARGKEVHARVVGTPPPPGVITSALSRFANPSVNGKKGGGGGGGGDHQRRSAQNMTISAYCACDNHIDRINATQAVDDLAKQLGNGVWLEKQAMYAKNGDVVSFVYKGVNRTWASGATMRAMISIIGKACGDDVVGAARYDTFAEGQAGAVTGLMLLSDSPQPTLGKIKSCPH
ncbi:hypothetical protein JDV02_008453 [Purpureocillium takamizusanense]|uniref:Uncharacterized protein n=1 Tax=Purpureocillium takamizusanense TaxID=2060973 RepID=A0A9Q8VF90_9HYPO|nr:uncharacterized protein JDV02_008453 [Purpureocillium takamizusanense]UNI22577.1 hypothetical protein JDV02_008453 [Purpureocillium takamizusanense]